MSHTLFRRVAISASAAALSLASGAATAQAASTPGWRTVATASNQSLFFTVAAAGQRHAWAVGFGPVSETKFVAVVRQWNGSSWTAVSLPAKVRSALGSEPIVDAASATSPSSMWALSETGDWLHYDGSAWTAGRVTGASILDASVAAGQNEWAFGSYINSSGLVPYAAYATDKNGKISWTRTPVPGTGSIADASALSSSDIWALTGGGVFGFGGSSFVLLHYDAGRWHKIATLPAALRGDEAHSVFARSDSDVWVGAAVKNSKKGTTEAVAHWNGREWATADLPAPASAGHFGIESIVPDGAGGLWALSLCLAQNCPGTGASRLWHETGGHWAGPVEPTLARKHTVLIGLAAVGHSVWAAGAVVSGQNNARGLIALWGPTP